MGETFLCDDLLDQGVVSRFFSSAKYFVNHLTLSVADANHLHTKYYQDYGLAVSGLAKHHKIDPLDFNREVDDVLPLEGIITPDPNLRALLAEFDRSKVKLWLFTNAHITHGLRVVKLLGVDDMFEGITYCDYSTVPLLCKPHEEMFLKAEREAGATDSGNCYFVGERFSGTLASLPEANLPRRLIPQLPPRSDSRMDDGAPHRARRPGICGHSCNTPDSRSAAAS